MTNQQRYAMDTMWATIQRIQDQLDHLTNREMKNLRDDLHDLIVLTRNAEKGD